MEIHGATGAGGYLVYQSIYSPNAGERWVEKGMSVGSHTRMERTKELQPTTVDIDADCGTAWIHQSRVRPRSRCCALHLAFLFTARLCPAPTSFRGIASSDCRSSSPSVWASIVWASSPAPSDRCPASRTFHPKPPRLQTHFNKPHCASHFLIIFFHPTCNSDKVQPPRLGCQI